MTLLVFGEKASRTHENHMLQAFLEHLDLRWGSSTDWIYVIANALWNGAEIDVVCIRPTGILVADFKAHGGRISGTENGPWKADGVLVKGGRKDNPYQQLRDNKFAVLNWLQSKALLAGRNLGHINAEHYRRLSAIRGEGDWEGWVSFFLEGVAAASTEAERGIINVASLITADRKRLLDSPKAGPISYRLFELLPMMPRFSVERVRQRLETTFPTASAAVKVLEDLSIVTEITGQKKNRVYSYQTYIALLSR